MRRGTDPVFFDEAVRAVSGYYGRLGRIGLDLAAIVIPIDRLRDAAARLPVEVATQLGRTGNMSDRIGVSRHPSDGPATSPAPRVPPQPALVVEADADSPGLGAFLVENLTPDPVSAPIHVSAFVDDRGREVKPRLGLRPSTVTLGPGEQAVVRVAAKLDDAFEPGVAYRGEITIPGVSERRIPVVLRRRMAGEPPTGDEPSAPRSPTRRAKVADGQAVISKTPTPKKRTAMSRRVTTSADDAT